jgi:hypothetical protein
MSRSSLRFLFLASAVCFGGPAAALPQLDRDPSHYLVLGVRSVNLKNFAIAPPGCSIGVNCPSPGGPSRCGMLRLKNASVAPPGQLASDRLCASDSFFEVFRNGSASCDPGCSMITDDGPAPDCSTPFAPPIVGDLDGDGAPSCSADCVPDLDDLASACGVTLPLPACDPAHPVVAQEGQDCGGDDVVNGNGQCDLPAGTTG